MRSERIRARLFDVSRQEPATLHLHVLTLGEVPAPIGEEYILYPAACDPVAEERRVVVECEKALAVRYPQCLILLTPFDEPDYAGDLWEAALWQPDCDLTDAPTGRGVTGASAALALRASLKPEEQPVGKMTDAELVLVVVDAGCDLEWGVNERTGLLSYTLREDGRFIGCIEGGTLRDVYEGAVKVVRRWAGQQKPDEEDRPQQAVEQMSERERAAEICKRLHVAPTVIYSEDGSCRVYARAGGCFLGLGSNAASALGAAVRAMRQEAAQ